VPTPLAVLAELKVPQSPSVLLPQVAVQSTPALLKSPATVALSVVVLPSARDEGGVVRLTVITVEALIVATAVALVTPSFAEVFAEVALIVTLPPSGTVDGAVYVVVTPLPVFIGLKLPQPEDPQLHVTPALCTSLVTTALRVAVPDVVTLNIEGNTVTVIGKILIVVLADLVESAAEVAAIVTVSHGGTVLGAEYVVDIPLRVCFDVKDPYEMESQVAVQLTPCVLTSLVMTALRDIVAPSASDTGLVPSVMVMGRSTIVIEVLEACDGSLVTRAVIVIVLSAGIAPGAM
jgi:hypothetical protein